MKPVLRLFVQTRHSIQRLLQHTLYMRLGVLLFCIVCCVVLMQAGSLFLLDYIPNSQSAIQAVQEQKGLWQQRLVRLTDGAATRNELLGWPRDQAASSIAELQWLQAQDDVQLRAALQQLQQSQQQFTRSLGAGPDMQVQAMHQLIAANDALMLALQRDMEVKQSVISLLQLMALLLVVSCLGAIAIGARRLLVQRVDALTAFVPAGFAQELSYEGDEFAVLEHIIYQLTARLEGYKAETEWFNQTSSERLRRMIRSHDFIYTFVESVNQAALGEHSLKKNLYLLQKAMNVSNAALVFVNRDSQVATDHVLYSHHKPAAMPDALLQELSNTSIARRFESRTDGVRTHCLAVGFASASGAFGILTVEAEEEYVFNETDKQLVELTAQLLSMLMGFQGREQEGRRVALLEERAAIARELHDSLAQSLSFMKIQIARLQPKADTSMSVEQLGAIVNELREGLDNAYRELRELLATFRVHMDVRGLGFAIQAAIDEFISRSNLSIALDNRLINCRLTVNEEFHILHVVREALSNIVRHSGANAVVVAMVFQSSGSVMITIDDDGIGYSAKPEEADHYGQTIMKERAYSLGGDLAVLRRRKGGTRVRLVFTPKLPQ